MKHVRKGAALGSVSRRSQSARVREHRKRLLLSLAESLSAIFRWSPDFYRPGRRGSGKKLAHETVFSAFLGHGLRLRGWVVEREALQGAGRRDIKATRDGLTAVVETKIWGRNDYKEIQRRLEGSWGPGMSTAVAVMIHHGEAGGLAEGYRSTCLSRPDLAVSEAPATAPILRCFRVRSTTAEGFPAHCDHLLFRIPGK